jgi:glycosyltransferase involved in cell wall biosynthesis
MIGTKFSVLMAVYSKEDPDHFRTALESVWVKQTLKPNEIVLIKDGPLTQELDNVMEQFGRIAPLKIYTLDKNLGLGIALSKGIHLCSNELIARMDSDDISVPDRFEKQIKFMMNHPQVDIVGTFIAEFNESTDQVCSERKLPSHSKDILNFARRRNPLNHMTVVFKKSAVLSAGNYKPFLGYEDYHLWVRMLQNGATFFNIPESLVFARIGNNMHARRHGFDFFIQELKLQKELHRIKFLNSNYYIQNIFLRAIPRLFPIWGLKIVYKYLRK